MQSLQIHPKDKKADYNLFKLVAGRNFKKVHAVGRALAEQMAKMLDMPQYDAFVQEASELREKGKSITHLLKKHKKVIDKYHATNVLLDKMLDEEVEIDLELFPLNKVPVRITGSFLHSIESMLLY